MPDVVDRQALAARIRSELDAVKDPCSLATGIPLGLDEMGLIDDVTIAADGAVEVKLRLTSPFCHMIGFFKTEADRLLLALPGVSSVSLVADNGLDWSPSRISPAGQAKREARFEAMRSALAGA
jgi:metal-sulfur cluster biosynthetic enzyme